MPPIFAYILGAILLIAVAFVAFYVFIALLVIGAGVYAFLAIRRWLVSKGIVNAENSPFGDGFEVPRSRGGRAPTTRVTVIEAEFESVPPPEQQDSKPQD